MTRSGHDCTLSAVKLPFLLPSSRLDESRLLLLLSLCTCGTASAGRVLTVSDLSSLLSPLPGLLLAQLWLCQSTTLLRLLYQLSPVNCPALKTVYICPFPIITAFSGSTPAESVYLPHSCGLSARCLTTVLHSPSLDNLRPARQHGQEALKAHAQKGCQARGQTRRPRSLV